MASGALEEEHTQYKRSPLTQHFCFSLTGSTLGASPWYSHVVSCSGLNEKCPCPHEFMLIQMVGLFGEILDTLGGETQLEEMHPRGYVSGC